MFWIILGIFILCSNCSVNFLAFSNKVQDLDVFYSLTNYGNFLLGSSKFLVILTDFFLFLFTSAAVEKLCALEELLKQG